MSKILAFAGSSRKKKKNKKLVSIAAQGAANAGAELTVIDLADFPLPLYNQDLQMEQGIPDIALQFKKLLIEHDGFLIASPEYNGAFSPLLKNVLDWASRKQHDDEPSLQAYTGKLAAIMAASPGGLGGLRGLVFLRMLLSNLGVTVLPQQQAIPFANKAFADDGCLNDEQRHQAVMSLGIELTHMVSKLKV